MSAEAIVIGDPSSPYLLTDEAAQFLRFKDARLFREWAKRNRVPVCRRGRTLLYRRSVLESLINQRHGRSVTADSADRTRNVVAGVGR